MKGRRAMCGPTGVGNQDLAEEGLGLVDVGFRKVLAQSRDLANLLEEQYLAGSIAINAYASAGLSSGTEERKKVWSLVWSRRRMSCGRWAADQAMAA